MANETVELFYNKIPINPNRDLPTRSYAEAQAEGLTSSDKLWVRRDGSSTPINAEQIVYDSNNSVKDMIDSASNVISVTGNSTYINGTMKTVQYVKFGKMVLVTGRFEITTTVPSGQGNYLFRGLPKPASNVVPVYDGSSDYLLLAQGDQNDGVITKNGALNTGYKNIMFCYMSE